MYLCYIIFRGSKYKDRNSYFYVYYFLYNGGKFMNEIIENNNIKIENMIYEIRGVQVMLDSDLAKLYQCKNGTKEINQAVKNNSTKFPERYSWKLSDLESQIFLVKNFDQKIETRGGKYKNPRVFTEEGVAMLATIIHTKVATEISIKIMDTFVSMRHFLINNKDIYKSLNNINNKLTNQENKLLEHENKFDLLFSKFDKKEQLFLEDQIYDAYSNILDLFKETNNELIIIDSYADKTLLDLIRNINCKVILITKKSDRLSNIEIDKYNEQYHNLKVFRNNSFHDRYFIIDRNTIYHSGTSINNMGSKIFMITKLEDNFIKDILLNKVLNITSKEKEIALL